MNSFTDSYLSAQYSNFRTAVLVSGVICCSLGYKIYQDEVPNGGSVPHPCKPNYIWQGAGHQGVSGGGARNPFGLAFKAAGLVCLVSVVRMPMTDKLSTSNELSDIYNTYCYGIAIILLDLKEFL